MYFEDIALGSKFALDDAVIDKDEMIDFARKYDNIPLHTDEEYASHTPFGKLIAPGLMSFAAVWAKYLEKDIFGAELLAGKSSKIEWLKPVFAGDVLSTTVTVSKLTDRSPRNGIAELSLSVTNQHGELVMTNLTEAVVKKRASGTLLI